MDNFNTETDEITDNKELTEATEMSEPAEEPEKTEVSGETATDGAEEPEKNNNYPTQAALTIRGIVGAYVIYLAYQLMTSKDELTVIMYAAVGLFIVAGSGLIIMSIKRFISGEYEGGKKDV